MSKNKFINTPNSADSPKQFAEKLNNFCAGIKPAHIKQSLGQFFTPIKVADFIAKFGDIKFNNSKVSIMEPGAGLCILSCALIEELVKLNKITEINLTCYESDLTITDYTKQVLDYLKKWLSQMGISLQYSLITEDFITAHQNIFWDKSNYPNYDFIISNPPFFKLSNNDNRVKIASSILHGLPNIYSIFFHISSLLLNKTGKLLFLIPRSFCSGSFYKQIRSHLLQHLRFLKIHMFGSEDKLFESHSVLFESVIIYGERVISNEENYNIEITHSNNINENINVKYDFNFNTNKNIIELPASQEDLNLLNKIHTYSKTLGSLGFLIGTGKAIITKVDKYLHKTNDGNNLIPFFWLDSIIQKQFVFPLDNQYGNFIELNDETKKYSIPNDNYIFLRRYNNNDYTNRIIATPYYNESSSSDNICIDRLISYIYHPNRKLSKQELCDISNYLNNEFVNSYLRIINGIINTTPELILDIPFPENFK